VLTGLTTFAGEEDGGWGDSSKPRPMGYSVATPPPPPPAPAAVLLLPARRVLAFAVVVVAAVDTGTIMSGSWKAPPPSLEEAGAEALPFPL
jgi:hypothetical protein